MQRSLIYVAVLVCGFASASLASAQVGGSDLRIGAGMVLDFGGEVDFDAPVDDDLKLTPGFRVHLDYDLGRYVSVGGITRFSWWEGDDVAEARSFLWDIGARVAGHYDWRDFRFYAAFAIGPTLSAINDDSLGGVDNPGFGVAVSIAPGVEYWFSNRVGLFLEMFGWSGHYFGHDLEVAGTGDVDLRINQVVWQLGLVFAP